MSNFRTLWSAGEATHLVTYGISAPEMARHEGQIQIISDEKAAQK